MQRACLILVWAAAFFPGLGFASGAATNAAPGWMREIRFVAYCPTGWDPSSTNRAQPATEGIRKDLETLRPYCDGLVLYSSVPPTAEIFRQARAMGFRGILLGVWDVRNPEEMNACMALAKRFPDLVKAICLGNEGLTFRRYDLDQLAASFAATRAQLPTVPLTTSEPISAYGDRRLQSLPDFHAPNIHPAIDRKSSGITNAVDWVIERASSLREVSAKPVFCKETGWPSDGDAAFTPGRQRLFWQLLLARAGFGKYACVDFALFEGFDLPWKARVSGTPAEGHWGFWTTDRMPKPVVAILERISEGPTKLPGDRP